MIQFQRLKLETTNQNSERATVDMQFFESFGLAADWRLASGDKLHGMIYDPQVHLYGGAGLSTLVDQYFGAAKTIDFSLQMIYEEIRYFGWVGHAGLKYFAVCEKRLCIGNILDPTQLSQLSLLSQCHNIPGYLCFWKQFNPWLMVVDFRIFFGCACQLVNFMKATSWCHFVRSAEWSRPQQQVLKQGIPTLWMTSFGTGQRGMIYLWEMVIFPSCVQLPEDMFYDFSHWWNMVK